MATNFQDLVAKVKNLGALAPVLGAISRPYYVILDKLHLMLRITDRLTENLIIEVMQKDSKENLDKKHGQKKGIHLEKLIKVINDLGITFSVWDKPNADGKSSGTKDWPSLVGSDKKKLMKRLPDSKTIWASFFQK